MNLQKLMMMNPEEILMSSQNQVLSQFEKFYRYHGIQCSSSYNNILNSIVKLFVAHSLILLTYSILGSTAIAENPSLAECAGLSSNCN